MAGGGNALTIAGAADIDGEYTGITTLSVTGAANIGANITSSGTQTYGGAVTISGGDRTLSGSTINTQSTLAGGNNALTIAGAADIDGAYSGLANLSITGAANIGANVTTSGTQTYTGAVTLSGGDRILTGTTINTQSTLAGGNNALTISGAADIDGAFTGLASLSITGTANIGANITTSGMTSGKPSGTQTFGGAVTISKNLVLDTSNADVTFNGFVDSASDAAYALDVRAGAGVVEFVRSVGLSKPLQSLSTADVGIAGLTQAIGTTKLGAQFGSIKTVGNQVFNNITMAGKVIENIVSADTLDMLNPRDPGSVGVTVTTETGGTAVIYPVVMTSTSGDLNFLGTVDGGGFAKTNMRSLQLNAAGQITFNDKVGFDASPNGSTSLMENYTRHYGIYRFDVTAPTINVLGDIAAYEQVAFNGATYIGGTAYNGAYRRIYSMDPKISFNGRVDGYGGTDGFYTLDARAISLDSGLPEPEINFKEDVGSVRQLAGLVATVARLDLVGFERLSNGSAATRSQKDYGVPTTANAGTIRFGGNVTTKGQQSYLANKFVIGKSSGTNVLEFNAESGDVDFTVGQGRMVSGSGGSPRIKFKNRPSSATISALKSSGAVITSEPNELSELVKLRETSKLSDAKAMDQNLDQRAGQSPTVEVGDLIPVNCNSIVDNNCTPESSANKPPLKK